MDFFDPTGYNYVIHISKRRMYDLSVATKKVISNDLGIEIINRDIFHIVMAIINKYGR